MSTSDEQPVSRERRDFLKKIGLAGAGLLLGGGLSDARAADEPLPQVPRRKFGRHDFTVSAMALGGHALAVPNDEKVSQAIVDEALARGINFFDNCWDYHDGRGEETMGKCIAGRRDKIFLMTKVCTKEDGDRKMAMEQLEISLKRFGTDHLDLWQIHAVATKTQAEKAFAPGGVIEALEQARKEGKVRYVGFTGHTEPEVHLAMLSHGYAFDAVQMPISPIEANSNAFVRRVLPELVKQQIAVLGMKSLGGDGHPVTGGVLKPEDGITYALSQPVTTVVSGITSLEFLRMNAGIAAAFKQMSKEEMLALEERCKPATESGKYQPYRKWMSYRDGDAAMIAAATKPCGRRIT